MMLKPFLKKNSVFRYLILAVLGAVIGVNVYTWNAARLAGNQIPMPFGFGASVVLSGSMEPALSVGDLLIIREAESYGLDDVVVYQSGRIPVVHRIVSMDDDTVTTRGDANNSSDEPVSREAIRGKVIAVIPLAGYAVWALKTPAGLLLTIAAAVMLVEFSYRDARKEKEQEKERLKAEIRRLMQELEEDTET